MRKQVRCSERVRERENLCSLLMQKDERLRKKDWKRKIAKERLKEEEKEKLTF